MYVDNAATTQVDEEVIEAMLPYMRSKYGNASSLHLFGREAYQGLEKARKQVADLLNASTKEIIFTSGGTESDNLAIKGIAHKLKEKGKHIITSNIEHPAVIEACQALASQGFEITYLPVDPYGIIDIDILRTSIKKETILISIMHGNNEIGTIEPIQEISEIAHEKEIIFHTDAVQTVGKIPLDMKKMNIDLLSISAHKIYGPKGVGALFKKEGVILEPLIHGGGHEQGFRSGTENVVGTVGLGKAAELSRSRMLEDSKKMSIMRDNLIEKVTTEIEESYLNGHPKFRLPNNAHFRFSGIEGESLLLSLDEKGIAASTGSACSSKKLLPSHVLMALGLNEVQAHGSLRISLGRNSEETDIEYIHNSIKEMIVRLREISPLWKKQKI
ncbi:cysteine desulfurase NifS [Candidatus Bathyarchaeota archaeon RBG_13_38_9]|nr:MAG: cysteine desulfurase NifS [Candidatus Bathyarchaeota archaeon RBG_13_38_9]